MFSVIETTRTYLRPMTAYDMDSLFELYNDPEVMRFIGNGQPKTMVETQAQLAKIIRAYHTKDRLSLYAVINKTDDRFMGRAGLWKWTFDNQEELEIAYMLGRAYWNNGLGTEVAQALLDFARLSTDYGYFISLIHPDNRASIHVAEKIGLSFWKNRSIYDSYETAVYRIDCK